jgi:serine/threonine protein kinase
VSAGSAGRYVSLKKIADGGMAEIFLAHQSGAQGFARSVIVKRIRPGLSADPQFRDMLIDEAHIAMRLSHRNVVPVLDLGQSRGRYFLVMELVDGWDLATIVKRLTNLGAAFPLGLGLYVVAEICRGLAYAHAHTGRNGKVLGIIHRDVSPHNVLLSEQGNVKLTDFGVAKALGKRDQTRTGIIKGKLDFMSPEQASGQTLAPSSDIFAAGTILYLLASGRRPFEGDSDLDILLKVQRAEFLPLAKAAPGLSRDVTRIVNRAMQPDPADRYQSGEAMMMDIEKVLRRDFGSPGQSELKRWLAELASADGAPTTSGLPALPVDEPLGPIGDGGTETLELEDSAIVSCSTDPRLNDKVLRTTAERPTRSRPELRVLVLLLLLASSTFVAMKLPASDSVAATVDSVAATVDSVAATVDSARVLLREANLAAFDPPPGTGPPAVSDPTAPSPSPPAARRRSEAFDRVTINVVTRPTGAGVMGRHGPIGRTPLRYTTRVGNTEVLRFAKTGYAPTTRRITASARTRTVVVDLRRQRRSR